MTMETRAKVVESRKPHFASASAEINIHIVNTLNKSF